MIGSSRRPIVKVEPAAGGLFADQLRHTAVCHTQGCSWTSGPHVVKAAAEEQARYYREQHRRGQA